jgi:MraZ protein
MNHFLGTHQNRLDAKGRVSIPASFRAALRDGLEGEGSVTVFLSLSPKFNCIDGWSKRKFDTMAARLAAMDPLTDEYQNTATQLYADTYQFDSDKEGRIMLSANMLQYAKLTGPVAFMAMGDMFQIWEPAACEARRLEARAARTHERAAA